MYSTLALLAAMAGHPEPPVTKVEMRNGVPAFTINGQPDPALGYMTYKPTGKYFAQIGQAGAHIHSFSANVNDMPWGNSKPVSAGPGEWDYSQMDEWAQMAIDNDPETLLLPLLFLGTPKWWADANTDEIVLHDPGDGNYEPHMVGPKPMASWASEPWREHTADALRRYLHHVETSSYADRMVGYQLNSGTTEEWMQWGTIGGQWTDYSKPNVEKFRGWLRDRYGSDAALQSAWSSPDVTLDTAVVPPPADRAKAEVGYLRDPACAQHVIDYTLYTSWLTADTVAYFAKVAKEATNGERIMGAYIGYILQLVGYKQEQNSGHFDLRKVLECPHLDFLSSPTSYDFRELATGYPHIMSLLDSVKAHGKMWFNQNDYRTWLTPRVPVGMCGKTATYEDTLLAQQREFAYSLVERLGYWWFDMSGGWYDDERLLKHFRRMADAAHECLDVDNSSVAEVAFVVDDRSSAYLKPENPFSLAAVTNQLIGLGRIGAPFATFHLADLDRMPLYKMYVLPNCIAPSADERALIEEKVKRKGVTVVWVGPAGLYKDGQLDESAMEDLTGLPLKLHGSGAPWRLMPTEAAAEVWDSSHAFGESGKGGLTAVAATSGVTVLGTLGNTNLPGLAMAERDGVRIVHSAVPSLPEGLLSALAQQAGVHLYSDIPDIVWATKDLLAVSVNEGGKRTVRLREPRRVVDLWSGETVADGVKSFEIEIEPKGTALFRLY